MKRLKPSTIIKISIVLIIISAYLFIKPVNTAVNRVFFIFSMLDVEAIKGYILSFGIWAPVVSFLLMIFQSVIAPLPAFLITFSNAALYGWVYGAILSWTSSMVGAILCYYIARVFGRKVTEKLTSRFALDEIDDFFGRYGKYAVLVARLLPFVSFDIVSYAAGLTSMSLWSFIWATGLGQLPATIIYSYVGDMLTGGTKMFVFGLMILFSISATAFMMKKVLQDKKVKATS